jgi:hypothetical protein
VHVQFKALQKKKISLYSSYTIYICILTYFKASYYVLDTKVSHGTVDMIQLT